MVSLELGRRERWQVGVSMALAAMVVFTIALASRSVLVGLAGGLWSVALWLGGASVGFSVGHRTGYRHGLDQSYRVTDLNRRRPNIDNRES